MNTRIVAIVLTLLCLLLAAGLIYRHTTATKDKKKDVAMIKYFSNELSVTSAKLSEQKLVNLSLERDLATQTEELGTYSNKLVAISADFAQVKAEAKSAAERAAQQLQEKDTRIGQLEGQRDNMSKKMEDLNSSISSLENQIADTQRRLEASEGDREFLLKELKRLQAEKTDLERQFNDLAMLRTQVRKLRDELSLSRRLEWIRRGLYGSLKGGELLRKGFEIAEPSRPDFNLDVEVSRTGEARVLSTTNSPAPEPQPNQEDTPQNTAPENK